MAAKKKPKGWRVFDRLAKGLAQVDKGKVDKKITKDKAKRIKKRKVIRNQKGQPFWQWGPAEKFAHVWNEEGLAGGDPVTEFVFCPDRKWRLDFAWPAQKLGVEIDGFGYGHQAQQQMARDNEKANAAVALGWRVLRYNSRQLGSRRGVSEAVGQVGQVLCEVG